MENNKTCHLYTYIFLLVLSFFLFSYNVKADIYNVTFSSSDTSYYNNFQWNTIISYLENYKSQNNYTNYFCYNGFTLSTLVCQLTTSTPTYSISVYTNYFQVTVNSTHKQIDFTNYGLDSPIIRLENNNSIINYFKWSNNETIYSTTSYSLLLTDFDIIYDNTSVSLNITNNNNYIIPIIYGSNFPTLYYIVNYSPPPVDNTPVLTDFYTLVIDKFSVIADFFVDNTYLFAIPLIPIFILCIYLIKRSLIK